MNIAASAQCRTTCPYCGVGCGVDVARDNLGKVTVEGSRSHPANLGRLCVKGSNLPDTLDTGSRLLHPQINGEQTDWDTALNLMATHFRDTIDAHGPDSVAFYLSGQLLTEDYYVANKLMKGFIGSANVDTNSRLCMASAVASYKRAFGADAVPCNYEDLEQCDLLVITGSNAAWTHPILHQRVMAARERRPGLRVVVIDPRQTATSDMADLHLPASPGSDGFLFNGLLRFLANSGRIDEDFITNHTEGFEESLAACDACHPQAVAEYTGIAESRLTDFYEIFAAAERVITFYSQGINQSETGTDKGNAIINCHLATGQLGRPGCGPFSITGQPNAMGGREVGGLANQLAAHMDFTPQTIDRVQRFWNAPHMATKPGLKAVDMFQAMADGRIKAVWIMATNPAVSLPDSARARAALERCDFVVVSECTATTDTTALADVVLPATTWGEKSGTVTNSERRISRQRAFLTPPGESRHDWQIVCDFASRLGHGQAFIYRNAADIFREHAALSVFENEGERLFNLGSLARIEDDAYEKLVPVQWPVREDGRGTARLFTERLLTGGLFPTPSGRARFVPVMAETPETSVSAEHRFVLNSGRLRDQWHTMTRTGLSSRLMRHTDSPRLYMHAGDYRSLALDEDSLVSMRAGERSLRLIPEISPGQLPGQLFAPIHWSEQFSGNAVVNQVYPVKTDPISGQPQSKWTRVSLRKEAMATWAYVVCAEAIDIKGHTYWHRSRIGSAWLYCLAMRSGLGETENLETQLGDRYPQADELWFSDSSSGSRRRLWYVDNRLQAALFLEKSRTRLPARDWLAGLPGASRSQESWLLLAGRDQETTDQGRLICSCFEVGEKTIRAAIFRGADSTATLGETLGCGSNCGSCLPELRQILKTELEATVANESTRRSTDV